MANVCSYEKDLLSDNFKLLVMNSAYSKENKALKCPICSIKNMSVAYSPYNPPSNVVSTDFVCKRAYK